jgi:hypothetical protein
MQVTATNDEPWSLTTPDITFTADSVSRMDVWYGFYQPFGHIGKPQRWVNILGKIINLTSITTMQYELNGSDAVSLDIGPNACTTSDPNCRLASAGDFNADIPADIPDTDLDEGLNKVVLTAVGTEGTVVKVVKTVLVDYISGRTWPLPYTVDWSTLSSADEINTVAQVVDGKWEIVDGKLHIAEPGYDRIVAIGDMTTWQDFEIEVPVTIHDMQPFSTKDSTASVVTRWKGHYDWSSKFTDPRPYDGWWPFGGLHFYFHEAGGAKKRIGIEGNKSKKLCIEGYDCPAGSEDNRTNFDTTLFASSGDVTYWYKAQVESRDGDTSLYRFKAWEQGTEEPANWNAVGQGFAGGYLGADDPEGELENGSALLLSYNSNISFGPVTIRPLP